jgi:hypothetical protein
MRFGDHGGAALVYKRGKCRGICVEIILDLLVKAVGFLINGAQRWFISRTEAGERGARCGDVTAITAGESGRCIMSACGVCCVLDAARERAG